MISILPLVFLSSLHQVAGGHNKILTEQNFKTSIQGEYTFVKFFAPWCPHCVNIKDDWDRLADYIHADKTIGRRLADYIHADKTIGRRLFPHYWNKSDSFKHCY